MTIKFQITNHESLAHCLSVVAQLNPADRKTVTITGENTRTNPQNAAMHKFFTLLADALNDAGLDQRDVMAKMKEGLEIPWSRDTVKENLWKPIQNAMLGKDSTTKLTTKEVTDIYEILNRFTASRLGVSIPFPNKDELIYQYEMQSQK